MSYGFRRICESGTDAHERIQYVVRRMQEYGFDCVWVDPEEFAKEHELDYLQVIYRKDHEVRFLDTRYMLTFMCDGIILYRGVYYVFEIKTETSSKFRAHDDVRGEHLQQNLSYLLGLGLDRAVFLYENRDWCDQKAYVFEASQKELMELQLKLEEYRECMKEDRIPATQEGIDCRGCQFKLACARSF